MGLPKGRTNNVAGRPTGTPNKVTNDLREKFTLLLDANFDKLQSDLDALESKDRIKALLELSKFVLPTLKATELTGNVENNNIIPVQIVFSKREFDERIDS